MKLENLVQKLENDNDIKWLKSLYKEKLEQELKITTIDGIGGDKKKLIIDLSDKIIACEFDDSKANISNRDFEKIKHQTILVGTMIIGNKEQQKRSENNG